MICTGPLYFLKQLFYVDHLNKLIILQSGGISFFFRTHSHTIEFLFQHQFQKVNIHTLTVCYVLQPRTISANEMDRRATDDVKLVPFP